MIQTPVNTEHVLKLARPCVSYSAYMLLSYLCERYDINGCLPVEAPFIELVKETKISRPTLCRALSELEKRNYLKIDRTQYRNTYTPSLKK